MRSGEGCKKSHIITDKHIEIIKKLKFKIITDSDYYNCQPVWLYEDNKDILYGEDIENIGISMQLIALLGNPTTDVESAFIRNYIIFYHFCNYYIINNSLN